MRQTPVRQTHIQKIERLTGQPPERATLRYFIRARSRHGAWTWFHRELVPPFDGEFAWFECERVRGGWKPVRQVPPPAWAK